MIEALTLPPVLHDRIAEQYQKSNVRPMPMPEGGPYAGRTAAQNTDIYAGRKLLDELISKHTDYYSNFFASYYSADDLPNVLPDGLPSKSLKKVRRTERTFDFSGPPVVFNGRSYESMVIYSGKIISNVMSSVEIASEGIISVSLAPHGLNGIVQLARFKRGGRDDTASSTEFLHLEAEPAPRLRERPYRTSEPETPEIKYPPFNDDENAAMLALLEGALDFVRPQPKVMVTTLN